MTAHNDTPGTGKDSIEIDWEDSARGELRELGPEELALLVEEKKGEVRVRSDRVGRALLNEGVPLTDDKVEEFWETVSHLGVISGVLAERVPEDQQFGESRA